MWSPLMCRTLSLVKLDLLKVHLGTSSINVPLPSAPEDNRAGEKLCEKNKDVFQQAQCNLLTY
jgi:hypothetical protein